MASSKKALVPRTRSVTRQWISPEPASCGGGSCLNTMEFCYSVDNEALLWVTSDTGDHAVLDMEAARALRDALTEFIEQRTAQ